MSKVLNENFITIQGWMVNELGLKGNELIVYAIIYGFSQAENQVFNGSLQYIADWLNTSKQTVINTLKHLQEKELIEKKEQYLNGVKFCEYYSKNLNEVFKKFDWGYSKNLTGGIQNFLPNNILDNKKDNIDNNIKEKIPYEEIIDCLNRLAGTNYRATSKKTRELINGRWEEGYRLQDFETVIKKKCDDWIGTKYEEYLAPTTLFRPINFERYLNAKINKEESQKGGMVF